MNWDAIGAIGETLGAVAVFVTLGYLAIQVRHARSEARRAISQGRNEAIRDLFGKQMNERVVHATVKAHQAMDVPPPDYPAQLMAQGGLTQEEALTVHSLQAAWWTFRLYMINYVDELPDSERRNFDRSIAVNYGRPGVARRFYEAMRPHTHPDVVRYIEDVINRSQRGMP